MALPAETRHDWAQLGTAAALLAQLTEHDGAGVVAGAVVDVVLDVVVAVAVPGPVAVAAQLHTASTEDWTGPYSLIGQAVSTHGVAAAPMAELLLHWQW